MKTKCIVTVVFAFCIFYNVFAEPAAKMWGIIREAGKEEVIAFANVVLQHTDSAYISGTTTNTDGTFEWENLSPGDYLIHVSYMGYESRYLPVKHTDKETVLDIELQESSTELKEVLIAASTVIVKDDRKIILPNQEQLRMSTDGVDMLRKMQLPRIMVDPVSGEVSLSGNGEVQLRINGVEVTNAEIASIPPQDILRIEYHDDPGARYGNAAAVIDYITRRKESGVNINAGFYNNIGGNRVSADDRIAIKYNYGRSEISANAAYVHRKQHWTRKYDEILFFPDYELHRVETGKPTLFNKRIFSSNLNYSFMEKDRYFFNAQLRYTRNDFPNGFEDRTTKLYSSDSDIPLSISNRTKEKANLPAVDLYYQQQLKNNQQLIFNVVGSYINTYSRRNYVEKRDETIENNIFSCINGDKYSLIAEGIYEKKIASHKLSGGVKHIQSYTNNQYSGTKSADVSLTHAISSVYAEYQGRTGKLGYIINLRAERLYYSQHNTAIQEWSIQPAVRLSFEPDRNSYLRYRINLLNTPPALAYMNDVEQIINPWQIRMGNPNLNSFRTLSQNFTAGYNKGIWGIDIQLGYDYEYSPIMELVYFEDNHFVRTYENQQSFQNLSMEVMLRLKPWKDHLNLSVTPRMNYYISTGNAYRHTYTMPELRINLDFTYNNWLANFTTVTPRRYMYGEEVSKSEQMYTIMIGYKQPKWLLMAGVLNPFSKEYVTENESWAALNPVASRIHTRDNKTILVKLAVNLNYGKQTKGNRKQLNNSDTDAGIMPGTRQ